MLRQTQQTNLGLIGGLEVDYQRRGGVCTSFSINKTLAGLHLIVRFIRRSIKPTESSEVSRNKGGGLVLPCDRVVKNQYFVSVGRRTEIQEGTQADRNR